MGPAISCDQRMYTRTSQTKCLERNPTHGRGVLAGKYEYGLTFHLPESYFPREEQNIPGTRQSLYPLP